MAFDKRFRFSVYRDGEWFEVPGECVTDRGLCYEWEGARYECSFSAGKESGITEYRMAFHAPFLTKLRLELELIGGEDYFHLIPCNIYGDNNAAEARPGEFPLLTEQYPGHKLCSPYWEFRADRAAMPLSVLCCTAGALGISADPYSEAVTEAGDRTIHNGLLAALPNRIGVTLGYTNLPVTVVNRSVEGLSRGDAAREAALAGTIYEREGRGRLEAHAMVQAEYEKRHSRAVYRNSCLQAARALFDGFVNILWDEKEQEYTNKSCRVPDNRRLRPWRIVPEIGWTGGGVLAYPLVLCRYLLPGLEEQDFQGALPGEGIIDRIIDSYHEESGLFYDLTREAADGSRVNGWWTGYGLVKDCHCAYNVGSALYYILKTILFLREQQASCPERWYTVAKKVMDTVIGLQREDGAFGYTYRIDRREVLDWEGFAGCWFAPCAVLLYRLNRESSYLEAARRALLYYGKQVQALNCWGAPMDTWKSVDQEGNLAFVRGCRLLYEETEAEEILELFLCGANYEYLWRYGYQTRPDHPPLQEGWNSCGGSVTSVSNPHIHPMGVLIDEDLRYLARVTGDSYHESRAEDSLAWLMQTLELYPEKTGYGAYGVLSERWCPSDGLTVEQYSDGRPYSSWFSYNLWAAANALEAVCERIRCVK